MEYELLALASKYADKTLPLGSVFKVGKILNLREKNFQELEKLVQEELKAISVGNDFSNPELVKALQNAEKIK